jgi:hypothetical protein
MMGSKPYEAYKAGVTKGKELAENKLLQLVNRCKAGVFLSVNDHRNAYESVQKFMENRFALDDFSRDETPPEVLAKMIETDTIVDLRFYPVTPIGSYRIFHYDLDLAVDEALSILDKG